MSDRLFNSRKELSDALDRDFKSLKIVEKRGDIATVNNIKQVISNKKHMLKYDLWK